MPFFMPVRTATTSKPQPARAAIPATAKPPVAGVPNREVVLIGPSQFAGAEMTGCQAPREGAD